ncbi:MAG: hypothetical protein AB7I48_18240, partial [Planctomycetaceae bacterium]
MAMFSGSVGQIEFDQQRADPTRSWRISRRCNTPSVRLHYNPALRHLQVRARLCSLMIVIQLAKAVERDNAVFRAAHVSQRPLPDGRGSDGRGADTIQAGADRGASIASRSTHASLRSSAASAVIPESAGTLTA